MQASYAIKNQFKPYQEPEPVYDQDYYEEQDYGYFYDRTKHPRFKTEMCRNIKLYSECTFKGCTFAHNESELRKAPKNLNKFPDLYN